MKQPSVLVLGNTTVDHVLSMPEPIQSDAKLNAKTYEVYAGGQASNVAAGLALLGHDVGFIGRFGDDSGAAISKRSFQEIGIDLSLSSTVSGCRHHFACILVNGSDRMIAMYRDPRLSLDDTEVPLDTVARCAAVYTDGHEGAASLRLAEKAARSGTPLIIDIEVVTPDTEALARLADHVVAPAEIVLRLGRESDLRNAMRSILGPARHASSRRWATAARPGWKPVRRNWNWFQLRTLCLKEGRSGMRAGLRAWSSIRLSRPATRAPVVAPPTPRRA
jgi:sugar/nucleoside kinase (ribokinase family)